MKAVEGLHEKFSGVGLNSDGLCIRPESSGINRDGKVWQAEAAEMAVIRATGITGQIVYQCSVNSNDSRAARRIPRHRHALRGFRQSGLLVGFGASATPLRDDFFDSRVEFFELIEQLVLARVELLQERGRSQRRGGVVGFWQFAVELGLGGVCHTRAPLARNQHR